MTCKLMTYFISLGSRWELNSWFIARSIFLWARFVLNSWFYLLLGSYHTYIWDWKWYICAQPWPRPAGQASRPGQRPARRPGQGPFKAKGKTVIWGLQTCIWDWKWYYNDTMSCIAKPQWFKIYFSEAHVRSPIIAKHPIIAIFSIETKSSLEKKF